MNASIVIPVFNPDEDMLKKIIHTLNNQDFKGKFEVLKIDKKMGFAKQINIGIKKSKYEIIVLLPQDCVPSDKYWLENLIAPFKDKNVIASVSKVHFPESLWEETSVFARASIIKEKGIITSLLDGKGSAYRKKTLTSVGYFDEENFRTAGEDLDMYMKLKDKGKIAYPDAEILHYHPTTYLKRLRKTYQYSNGGGAAIRIYGSKVPRWYFSILKAVPLVGILGTILSFPFSKGELKLFPIYIIESVPDHLYYLLGFWKGFLTGKQTV